MKKQFGIHPRKIKYLGWIVCAVLWLFSIASAGQSLSDYHQAISTDISVIVSLVQNEKKLLAEQTKIEKSISSLKQEKNPGWVNRRKIAKLTEKKAKIGDRLMIVYKQTAEKKTSANRIFDVYFPFLSSQIDSVIDYLEKTAELPRRTSAILTLLELKDRRDWLLQNQRYFAPEGIQILPGKENPLELVKNPSQQALLKTELVRILNEKIDQIDLIITAAKEEELLRKRMAQFASEMTAFSGEINPANSRNYQTTFTETKSSGTDVDVTTYGTPTSNGNGEIWTTRTIQTEFPMTMNSEDYLHIVQSVPSKNMRSYISQLDSIKTLYLKQIAELEQPKR
ncbi:MAG: hypothetical protein PHW79_01660 [Candidatus Marinimicrobia bacterium]|nr:hypothetical protein [Candidatus Neomarinimicrobiota bacterium]